MEGTLHKYHEDHIAGKGINSFEPLKSCAYPMPYAIKIPDAKAKFRCQPQCFANFIVTRAEKPAAPPEDSRQNTPVLLKPMNL